MIKVFIIGAFFLTLAFEELIGLGLVVVPGLSAKNAYLYVLLLTILCSKVINRTNEGVQFPIIHLLFFLIIADVTLSIFYMHFVSGDTVGYGLFGHVALMKSHLVDMYLMFIVFFYGVDSKATAINAVKIFLFVIGLIGLISLLDVLNVLSLGLMTEDLGDAAEGRLRGPLGGPNAYGVFFAAFIPILVIAAAGMGNGFLRLVYAICAAVCFALLLQTGSRGGFVSLIGSMILAAWWLRGGYDFRKAAVITMALLAVALLLATVVFLTNEDVRSIVMDRLDRSTSGNLNEVSAGRLWIWGQGLDYLMAQPWRLIVGVGWGAFWTEIGIAPHSNYMNYLFSVGIIGLGIFLALLFHTLVLLKKGFFLAEQRSEERLLIGGLTVAWFALLIAMSTGTNLKAWLFIWPITGLCLRVIYLLMAEEGNELSRKGQEPQATLMTELRAEEPPNGKTGSLRI